MSAAHTPGPWAEHPRDGIPAVGIDVGDGGPLLPIVDVVRGKTKAEAKKNRRLIAAAPDLLDALKKAKWMLERDYIDDQKMAVIEGCETAIAKATGAAT